MQRRNVLLPEPDGPIMHMTSLGKTSRSMPRRTSSRPKFLWTPSALTIGAPCMSAMLTGQHDRYFRGTGRRSMEGHEHPPKPLKWCQRQSALRAAAEMALEVVLPDGQDRGHQQIPEARDDEQLQDRVGGGGDLLLASEELSDRGGEGQRTGLQHRDGLIPGRRDDDAHRLWQHDSRSEEQSIHAQGLGRLCLTVLDGDHPGPNDLGHVRRL